MLTRPCCFQAHYCMLSLDPILESRPVMPSSSSWHHTLRNLKFPGCDDRADQRVQPRLGINNSGQCSFGNGFWSELHDRNVHGRCQTGSYRVSFVCHWSSEFRWKGFPEILPICQLECSQTEFPERRSVYFPMKLAFSNVSYGKLMQFELRGLSLQCVLDEKYSGQQGHLVSNKHRITVRHVGFTLIWPSPDDSRHALA